MSKKNINRVDFEAVQLMCRTASGQLCWAMPNSVEFDGIRNQAGLERLNRIAIQQMTLLAGDGRMKLSGGGE